MSQSISWGKVGIVALVVAVLGGGAVGYFAFFHNLNERALKAGERALKAGDEAFADDPGKAALRYEEAVLQARKVLDDIDRQLGTGVKSQAEGQRLGFLQGWALWLKARALRDHAFAAAAADGKPLAETADGTLGGTFRSVGSIPDPEERREAIRCLQIASRMRPDDGEVQREALRIATMSSPPDWRFIEAVCKQTLELVDADDTRALYQMALLHYEQAPVDAKGRQGPPPPLEKRSAKRMKESRDYLERAQKTKNARYWRTAEMQARITRWMRDFGATRPEDRRKEDAALKALLAEGLKKGEDEKATATLLPSDVRALLALHQMALTEEARNALKEDGAAKNVTAQLGGILALCARFAGKSAGRPVLEECARAATAALDAARPSLRSADDAWDAKVAQAAALAERARDAGVVRPEMYAALVRFFGREAFLHGRKGDKARQKKSAEAADRWLEDGLARGQKAGLSPEQLGDLHALAAERKAQKGEGADKLKAHLDVLLKARSKDAQALGKFIEGISLERQGRLAAAARRFEEAEALASPSTRTDAALASLYLSLGRPGQALTRLGRLLAAYKRLDDLTEQERAWASEFIRSKEDLQLQYVTASLDAALANIQTELARSPGRPVPPETHEPLRKQAAAAAAELPAGSPQARSARLATIRYLTFLGKKEEVRKELAAFDKAFPGDSGALPSRVTLTMLPEAGVKDDPKAAEARRVAADALIQAHLKANPADTGAKLQWATWLSRTGRADKAVAYLKDAANFPESAGEDYRRVLALALIGSGDQAGGAEVLRQLPASPLTDLALIRLASAGERDKLVAEALARHERDGLVRCMAGAVELEKGKFAEAAESFFKALEFVNARHAAERGLQQALVAHASKDPNAARTQITRMLGQAPDEKALYLAYAYASLLLDDLGQPFQAWENVRNMATALRSWETLLKSPSAGLLTRAELWRLAGRPDLALAEARRAIGDKDRPPTPQALALGADLAIAAGDTAALSEADAWLTALEKAAPDSPAVGLLRARLLLRRKPPEARKAVAALVAKHPDSEPLRQVLLELALDAKDTAGAEAGVTEWRARKPDSAAARGAAIRLLALSGKLPEAKALAAETHAVLMKRYDEQAAKAKPPAGTPPEEWKKKAAEARAARSRDIRAGLIKPLLLARAFAAASAAADEVLAEAPEHLGALNLAGEAAFGREDWKAARGVYERIHKLAPKAGIAANNLAWLLVEKAGDPARAREVIEPLLNGTHSGKPLAGDRIDAEVLDTVGLVYRTAKDQAGLERAKLLLTAGRRRYADDPRLALHLGHILAALEDARPAREMFQTAIRLAGQEGALDAAQRGAIVKEAEAALKKVPR